MLTGDPFLDKEILLSLPIKEVLSLFSTNSKLKELDKDDFWQAWLKQKYPSFVFGKGKESAILMDKMIKARTIQKKFFFFTQNFGL